jgi:hypothetical protein
MHPDSVRIKAKGQGRLHPLRKEIAMAKPPSNHNKPWTPAADKQLRELAAGNTPTRVIGLKLGRTEGSIYGHAGDLGVSLKPTNQSPYGTKKK